MLASCNGLSKAKQNEARDLELWSPSRLYYLVRYLGKGTYLSWEAHVNNVPSRHVTSRHMAGDFPPRCKSPSPWMICYL